MSAPLITDEPGLSRYIDETRRFQMLEPQEEYLLAKRWREHGDRTAADQLVTSHLRLVVKIAMGYRGYGLPICDVVSEGNVGLMQAVKRFEPEKGFRFSTYAMWWIKAAIQEYILRSWSMVRMGTTANQRKLFFGLRKAKSRISALDEGDMRPDQVKLIAKRLGVTEQDVIDMNRRLGGDVSLNAPCGGDDGDETAELQDFLRDDRDGLELNSDRIRASRRSPCSVGRCARRAQRTRTRYLGSSSSYRRAGHTRRACGRNGSFARACAPDRSGRLREGAEGSQGPRRRLLRPRYQIDRALRVQPPQQAWRGPSQVRDGSPSHLRRGRSDSGGSMTMALESTARRQPADLTPAAPPYRTAPHNIELEQALLGAILVNNEAFYRVSDFLEPRHFFEPIHQKIYEIAASLVRAGRAATPITLKSFLPPDLDVAGQTASQYLARLAAEGTTILNAPDYGRTVCDLAARRSLIGIGQDMVNEAYDAPVDMSSRLLASGAIEVLDEIVASGKRDSTISRMAVSEAADEAVEQCRPRCGIQGQSSGSRTACETSTRRQPDCTVAI